MTDLSVMDPGTGLTLEELIDAFMSPKNARELKQYMNHYKGRWCTAFHCDERGDRFCCADCWMRRDCANPCMNHPTRCKLEDLKRKERAK